MEIVESYHEHEQAVKRQIRGISSRVLKNMTLEQLQAEQARVTVGIRKWEAMVRAQPRWFRAIPEVRRERCVLKDEMQRVNSELMRRAHAAIEEPRELYPDGPICQDDYEWATHSGEYQEGVR